MLSLNAAQSTMAYLLEIATNDGLPPITISICDGTGHSKLFARMDGAALRSIAIAQGKAYTASRMGTTTTAFYERLHKEKIELAFFCDNQLTAFSGGSPISSHQGLLGGIGVSGRAPMDDQYLADLGAKYIAELLAEK